MTATVNLIEGQVAGPREISALRCGPLSPTARAHADELADYDTSKGTIRFQADEPLPTSLVRKLVKARLAENEGRSEAAK